jgi:predicted naringenin-chalcone synthase
MSYIYSIETANPEFLHSQKAVTDFYCGTLNGNDNDGSIARRIRVLSKKSGINSRYSVLSDFSEPHESRSFFPGAHEALLPGLSARMKLFREKAVSLCAESVRKIQGFERIRSEITHIITVSCTGLSAPGLELQLIGELGLSNTTARAAVNFMGCNAGILGLRQAHQICHAEPGAVVLLCCVELCSIHFQQDYTEDYLLSNLLFGDGASASIISNRNDLPGDPPLIGIKSFKSMVVPEGRGDMAWDLSENGFLMRLSPEVSRLLSKSIHELFDGEIKREDIRHWAIHPGGRRILDDLCNTMNFDKVALNASYQVLEQYGNMSSVTIFYVIKQILADQSNQPGDKVFAAAFGPGLTIESALLEYV